MKDFDAGKSVSIETQWSLEPGTGEGERVVVMYCGGGGTLIRSVAEVHALQGWRRKLNSLGIVYRDLNPTPYGVLHSASTVTSTPATRYLIAFTLVVHPTP